MSKESRHKQLAQRILAELAEDYIKATRLTPIAEANKKFVDVTEYRTFRNNVNTSAFKRRISRGNLDALNDIEYFYRVGVVFDIDSLDVDSRACMWTYVSTICKYFCDDSETKDFVLKHTESAAAVATSAKTAAESTAVQLANTPAPNTNEIVDNMLSSIEGSVIETFGDDPVKVKQAFTRGEGMEKMNKLAADVSANFKADGTMKNVDPQAVLMRLFDKLTTA